ncbi:MAG: hypothetical protein QM813_27820 [Verrucomicrobiota bacterium]
MKAFVSVLLVGATLMLPGWAATTNLYSTQFENAEGFSASFDLAGQQGWNLEGSGGNGLIANGLEGQSAYIGFAPPNPADDSLILYRPINFNPSTGNYPIVKFSVLVNLQDSTNGRYDIFRWSVFNQNLDRLFLIDFDNDYLDVSYRLDGTNRTVFTSLLLTNKSNYQLDVTMNFAANRWSATLNNKPIATNQFITTINAPLNLGDIDAVWLVNQITYTNGLGQAITTNAPGNNYMIFDNYRITAETIPISPARVNFLGRTGEGWSLLRVSGTDGLRWAVDATTNLTQWTALKTNLISGGSFDLVDTTAAGQPRRFYRARLAP